MCGILCIFTHQRVGTNAEHPQQQACCNGTCTNFSDRFTSSSESLRELAFRQSSKQRHRGPDQTGLVVNDPEGFVLVQERLSVIGVKTGRQPFTSTDGTTHLVANGEIYNFAHMVSLIHDANGHERYKPRSDCDVLVAFYELFGPDRLLQTVRGMFAFVLYDCNTHRLLVARDPVGIVPLYYGWDQAGSLWIASELKCLVECCREVVVFPPGHAYYGTRDSVVPTPYFNAHWMTEIPSGGVDLEELKHKLEAAVESHLQCEVPLGALLSGGLDSSLIASIATRILRRNTSNPNYRLKTYSIGLDGGGPDLQYARTVANYIGSDHTEIHFTISEGLDFIRDAVYHAETYDVTTIRCIVPVMLLARAIRSEGIRVVLSGEGADELFGGYLYFHLAPNVTEFHRETVCRVLGLHLSDCLRANKGCAAWGLELRVPFLDTDFLQYVMSIRPQDRAPGSAEPNGHSGLEKRILRQAFAKGNYVPREVLWRQKEQFSDGVGYAWIDAVSQWATDRVSEKEFEMAVDRFPFNTPTTKEAYYYRKLFEQLFPGSTFARTVQRWMPRTDWGCPEDPSGRKQTVHQDQQKK
ncbi:probable asparagine synthetase [glutamine-hydrolyzing] [Anopheles stephensi]|uniref:probable asparagine synthetase [glutamine-hydrolyzing] n=1 Tax=Anopheles stephensi TaxID=30069 RepID=UPI001658BCDB|nr:probable asparagine synthetase [glutamine-hydrolyzing] [Anopheles stephensi]